MKILIVNPLQSHLVSSKGKIYNRVWSPLSEANCAALLEQEGHEVVIVDANAERLDATEVAKRSIGFDKIFITSSPIDRWQCPVIDLAPFLSYVKALKEINDEVYITGAHGTVRPEEMLALTGVKAVIRGEPELTVLHLCRNDDLSKVRGISYKSTGEYIHNKPQDLLDLEKLPVPSFHLLPMEKYFYEVLGKNFTLLEASRGCTYRCSFCLLDMYGKKLRVKSPQQVINELDTAINKYHVKNAYFMDLEFTVNRNLVEAICDYLISKRYDFKWTCQTRFDMIDEHLLDKMKRAGCDLIHFGVEAGNDKSLRALAKGMTVEKIEAGMKMIKKVNMRSACFFLMGVFGSTEEDMQEITRFSMKLNPTYALFHIAIPYPGTKFHSEVINSGPFFSDNNIFPEAYVGEMTLDNIKTTTRNAYIKYYFRPRYVLSMIRHGHLKYLYWQLKIFLGFISRK
jgi:anaerobic magnesium-protoporphyrin IX monomethyl ester cyclase